jgi:HlyD family secretion protein
LKAATLTAPTDGIVASVSATVGQWISGGASSTTSTSSTSGSTTSGTAVGGFITLANISQPQVTAQVSEADIGRVRPGQKVTFTVSSYPGRTFSGVVARIDPIGQTVSNVVNYNVVASVDPTDVELLPSMTATINIITEQIENVTLVPNAAISFAASQPERLRQTDPEGESVGLPARAATPSFVLLLREGQPVGRRIQIGSSDDRNTQVLSGLQLGEEVVVAQTVDQAASRSSGQGSILPGPKPGGGGFQKPGSGGGGGAQKPGGGG